jgi:hypothetical protein
VAQIAGSIREWGWTMPVLVDERGGLIAGYGRVLAAQRLGIVEIPTMPARPHSGRPAQECLQAVERYSILAVRWRGAERHLQTEASRLCCIERHDYLVLDHKDAAAREAAIHSEIHLPE